MIKWLLIFTIVFLGCRKDIGPMQETESEIEGNPSPGKRIQTIRKDILPPEELGIDPTQRSLGQ